MQVGALMALYPVGSRVRLKSGKLGSINSIIADRQEPADTFYEIILEPDGARIRLDGLHIDAALPTLGALPPNIRDAARGVRAFSEWPKIFTAMSDIDGALCAARQAGAGGSRYTIKYVLQGSSAAVLHGASVSTAPGDLDICVALKDRPAARQALLDLGCKSLGTSTTLVGKYCHPNGAMIDLVDASEFGINLETRCCVQGVWTLPVFDTLLCILLRIQLTREARQKDQEAFNSLIIQKGHALSEAQQDRIVKKAQTLGFKITSWQGIVDMAQQANIQLKLGH